MEERFDVWTKQLGAQHDRRGVVKTAAVGALGLLGLGALPDDASAKQCKKNKDCKNNKKVCKGGKCVECKNNGQCKKNQKCKNNKCKKKN